MGQTTNQKRKLFGLNKSETQHVKSCKMRLKQYLAKVNTSKEYSILAKDSSQQPYLPF